MDFSFHMRLQIKNSLRTPPYGSQPFLKYAAFVYPFNSDIKFYYIYLLIYDFKIFIIDRAEARKMTMSSSFKMKF